MRPVVVLEPLAAELDLNNPEFQANLLALDKPDAWAVLKTLRLLQTMS